MGREATVLDAALMELSDLCRRTKRTMQGAQRALLPAELLGEFGLA